MGNKTNKDAWAGRQRLRFIELKAWWCAELQRPDLLDTFGISSAQASSDLQTYLDMNPNSMSYNLRSKRYESSARMKCVMHQPSLAEAVSTFLGGELSPHGTAAATPYADVIQFPARSAKPQVERNIFIALQQGKSVKVEYAAVQGESGKREIAPHALAFDGYRWHTRAWCLERKAYRDFVLSRIISADWPTKVFEFPEEDVEWDTLTRVTIKPNSALTAEQQKAVAYDFGMDSGSSTIKVRQAMLPYLASHLRIKGGKWDKFPALLEGSTD